MMRYLPELDDSVNSWAFDAERAVGQDDRQRVGERERRFAWLVQSRLRVKLQRKR